MDLNKKGTVYIERIRVGRVASLMVKNKKYYELNHEDNTRHYKNYNHGGTEEAHAKTWLDPDTVDAWRHRRMYSALNPLLKDERTTWLTIGDGRFGTDSRYICENGGDATASDIDDSLLQEAATSGFISKFSKENAESLSFEDGSFDFVFCKESYHHLPRPTLALYEMLRVASMGVVLIEPNDRFISYSLIRNICTHVINKLLSLVGRDVNKFSFEEFGNYVYPISQRELEKVALGMNYRYLAFKGINDSYQYGVEFEKVSENGSLFRKVKFKIMIQDLLVKLRIIDSVILVAIIFKELPSVALLRRLEMDGFDVVELPVNPYAHGSV